MNRIIAVDYDEYLNTLADVERFIGILDNTYQWREMSGIMLSLQKLSNVDGDTLLTDLKNKMYELGYYKK